MEEPNQPPVVLRTTRRIEFVDTDMAGIVHFSNFFRFMEAAEVEFMRSRGLSVAMNESGMKVSFPRVGASCDYVHPARFQDVLDIEVRILRIGSRSVTYGFEFFCQGKKLAKGQVSSVCCRILPENRLESMEIPAEYRKRLEGN